MDRIGGEKKNVCTRVCGENTPPAVSTASRVITAFEELPNLTPSTRQTFQTTVLCKGFQGLSESLESYFV